MSALKWEKAYEGPFDKKLAQALAADLKTTAKPAVNSIHDARAIRRPNCPGEYDVEILTDNEKNV